MSWISLMVYFSLLTIWWCFGMSCMYQQRSIYIIVHCFIFLYKHGFTVIFKIIYMRILYTILCPIFNYDELILNVLNGLLWNTHFILLIWAINWILWNHLKLKLFKRLIVVLRKRFIRININFPLYYITNWDIFILCLFIFNSFLLTRSSRSW